MSDELEHVRAITSDLEGFIERRAAEMASPMIRAAAREADEKVRAAEADAQRWKDANTELGRHLTPLERMAERHRSLVNAAEHVLAGVDAYLAAGDPKTYRERLDGLLGELKEATRA